MRIYDGSNTLLASVFRPVGSPSVRVNVSRGSAYRRHVTLRKTAHPRVFQHAPVFAIAAAGFLADVRVSLVRPEAARASSRARRAFGAVLGESAGTHAASQMISPFKPLPLRRRCHFQAPNKMNGCPRHRRERTAHADARRPRLRDPGSPRYDHRRALCARSTTGYRRTSTSVPKAQNPKSWAFGAVDKPVANDYKKC